MELNEGYVIGLAADVGPKVPKLSDELRTAKQRAEAVDAELASLLRRLETAQKVLHDAKLRVERSNIAVAEKNHRTAMLHQEIATLKKRGDDYKAELERAEPGELQRRLRRERAKLTVQVEDREQEIAGLKEEIESHRKEVEASGARVIEERDRARVVGAELDRLQKELPRPELYADLGLALLARAHCDLFLDRDRRRWDKQVREAVDCVLTLHRELRAGKYRLDKNSELVGGRSMASAETLFAAVAIDDLKLAGELFSLMTDPALYFHQIFNVFRVWCLGLYLGNRHAELRHLLSVHQYSEGLRGAYVQTFLGLVAKDARRVATGLRDMTRHEWELWSDPNLERGAGVVNLGAVALGKLALARGIAVQLPGPTVPDLLIAPSDPTRTSRAPAPPGRPS